MLSFEQANAQQELSKSLLRLTATLQQSMLPFFIYSRYSGSFPHRPHMSRRGLYAPKN